MFRGSVILPSFPMRTCQTSTRPLLEPDALQYLGEVVIEQEIQWRLHRVGI